MTTPGGGGGEGSNEIELVVRTVVEGDATEVVRAEGERVGAAFNEGVGSVPPVALRAPNMDALWEQVDTTLDRVEERVRAAARNMNVALNEGTSGSQGLFGHDLTAEMERYRQAMESFGGSVKTTFVGDFAKALQNDTRLLEQGYDRLAEVNAKGRNIPWALNSEGREFLSRAGETTSSSDVGGHFQGGQFPLPPSGGWHGAGGGESGDLDRIRAQAQESLTRVTLDDAKYALENGEFFKVNKGGLAKNPVQDPELQARLTTAVQAQMAGLESDIVQQHLREFASRPGSAFLTHGIDPNADYPIASGRSMSGMDVGGVVQEGVSSGTIAGLQESLNTLKELGLQAPEVLGTLEKSLTGMREAAYEAVQAADLEASATSRLAAEQDLHARLGLRPDSGLGPAEPGSSFPGDDATHRRLEAAFQQPLPEGVPAEMRGLGTSSEVGENDYLRMLTVRRQMAEAAAQEAAAQGQILREMEQAAALRREAFSAQFNSPEAVAARQATQDAERDARQARNAAALGQLNPADLTADQRRVVEEFQRNLAGGGGAGGLPPRAPGAAGFPDDDPSIRAAMARLAQLTQITQAEVDAGRLTNARREEVSLSGSTLDGHLSVRGPDDTTYRMRNTGTLEEITQTDALMRAQSDLAMSTRVVAEADALLEKSNSAVTTSYAERTIAQNRAIDAQMKLAAAIESNDPGKIASAQERVQRTSAALQKEQEGPPEQRNFGQAFVHAALGGDKSQDAGNAFLRLNSDNGEFLGAIARYQAAYAVIFGLSQAFHSVLSEEEEVQRAMVEFSEATGLAGDKADNLASSLATLGSRSGLGAAASIEAGTRGAFAFGQETQGADGGIDPTKASTVATASTQSAAVATFITQAKDASVVQGQLIATTLAFNLASTDQSRVLDAAANAARHYGAATGDILAGLPGVAGIAKQAGLSVEETANIISVAAVRTAQSGTAVSTAIGRVLENINSKPQTKSLLDTFGIDTTGTAGQTLESLAGHWKALTTAQQDQVIASLGGVRAAKDLIPVLQEGDGILKATADSYKEGGYAQELFYKQLNTIGGLLATIGGDLQLLGHDLAGTGLFTLFGAALKAVDPFLVAIDDVLKLLDGLNNATGGWLIPLAEAAAILTYIAKQMATISTEQAVVTAETTAEAAAVTRTGMARLLPFGIGGRGAGAAGAARQLTAAESLGNPLTGELAVGGESVVASGGLAAMGGALFGTAGVIAGLVAMAVAIGAVTSAAHAETQARKDAEAAQKELRTAGSDPGNYRSAASALNTAAVSTDHANSGFGGFIAASPADRQRPDLLRTQAAYANEEANRLEAQQRAEASANAQDVYFTNTGDRVKDLTNGLAAMSEAGVPAVRALELLNAQINGLGTKPGSKDALSGVFATEGNVATLTGAVGSALGGVSLNNADTNQGQPSGGSWWSNFWHNYTTASNPGSTIAYDKGRDAAAAQVAGIDPNKIRTSIQDTLDSRGIVAGDIIDAPTQAAIAGAVIHNLGLDKILTGQGQAKVNAAVRSTLRSQFGALSTTGGPPPMTDAEFKNFIEGDGKQNKGLAANLQAWAGEDDPTQLDPSGGRLAQQLKLLKGLAAQGHQGGDQTILLEELHKTEADYVKSEVDRLERLRTHAAGQAGSPEDLAASEAKFVTAEARTAIANNDPAALLDILNTASDATIHAVRLSLEADLRIAQAAYNKALAAWKAYQSVPAQIRAHDPDLRAMAPPPAPDPSTVQGLQGALGTVDSATGTDHPKQDPTALGLSAINAKADPYDAVQSARVAVEAAQYTLDHAKGQTERNNAQKALNEANKAYGDAVAQQTQVMRSAGVDSRDTVGEARVAMENAKTALDATHKGTTAYYQALAAYNQAQTAYAQSQQGLAAAAAAANVRQGDPLSAATASLHAADTALQNEVHGTVGWYNALAAFRQSQYAYGQALLAHQHEARLNGLDLTDPVAMANENLRAAQATLARDKHNGTGDLAADKNAVTTASNAAQAALFSQRLSDVTTAHDLQRMSDAAYMAYLQSQHDSLVKIQHRTRQQTDELNQIDQAIKAASDQMQGQFNLGDIKVPTVYEVRRSITLGVGTGDRNSSYVDARQVNVNVNGADVAKVKAVVLGLVGSGATGRTAVNRSKT